MALFASRSSSERKASFLACISMSLQDGHMDPREVKACLHIGARLGCTESEIRDVMTNPGSVQMQLPRAEKDRAALLLDLLVVAHADGEFTEDEMKAFAQMAMALDYTPEQAGVLLALVKTDDDIQAYLDSL